MSALAVRTSLILVLALGCAAPIVDTEVHEIQPKALRRIAVAPFQAVPHFRGEAADPKQAPLNPAETATLVTRYVTEAFGEAGFDMVPASDLIRGYAARGAAVPHADGVALARQAQLDFGATALLRGKVSRFIARRGGELGATRPAAVGFELTLYEAPSGRKLWSARFDHTQQALSENLFRAPRYPGGGTRWLSAAELSRWGGREAARSLKEHP